MCNEMLRTLAMLLLEYLNQGSYDKIGYVLRWNKQTAQTLR
jgi:hypothetical protein